MGNTDLRLKDMSPEHARKLIEERLDPTDAARWAKRAQALADPTRLEILDLLSKEGELCVSNLCLLTERGQSAVSRHVGILRDAGLIESYRFDLWVYSKLTPLGKRLLEALTAERA
jgi:ArsR family transcriptional regulator